MQNETVDSMREKIDAIIRIKNSRDDNEKTMNLLEQYVLLLQRWMQTHNVISRKNTVAEIWENIYDSLVPGGIVNNIIFNEFESQKKIVDAGSGGGFPGIPLAILFPEKQFILVDISRKKCSFLRSAKARLNLVNVSVLLSEIQDIESADFIVSKAAFSPPNIGLLAQALKKSGHLLLWATINTRVEFKVQLQKHGLSVQEEYEYSFGDHPQRSLLFFVKES